VLDAGLDLRGMAEILPEMWCWTWKTFCILQCFDTVVSKTVSTVPDDSSLGDPSPISSDGGLESQLNTTKSTNINSQTSVMLFINVPNGVISPRRTSDWSRLLSVLSLSWSNSWHTDAKLSSLPPAVSSNSNQLKHKSTGTYLLHTW